MSADSEGNHDDDVRSVWPVFPNNYDEMRRIPKSHPFLRSIPFSSVNEVNNSDGLAFYEFLSDMNSISMLRRMMFLPSERNID